MATTQDDRLLKITTPLGKDFLLLEKMTAHEGLSQLFSFEVELLHEEDKPGYEATVVDAHSLLGQTVSIDVEQPDKKTKRSFCGIVSEFVQGRRNERFSFYTAKIVPKIWLLTQIRQSRTFQHISVPDILKKVLSGYDVSYEFQATYKPRNFCVQYAETDFDFISRLMEEEGIFYYFEHGAGKHKMIVADSAQTHRDCPTKSDIPYILKLADDEFVPHIKVFHTNYNLLTGKIAFRDHHFQLTTNTLEGQQPSRYSIGGNQSLENYAFPAGYARKYDDIDRDGGGRSDTSNISPDKDKTLEVAMQALDAEHKVAGGTAECCSMTAGYRFKLKNNPNAELNKQYIITSISHTAVQTPVYISDPQMMQPYGSELSQATLQQLKDSPPQLHPFVSDFKCLLHGEGAPPFRAPRKTAKPQVRGSQTAMVVGPAGEEIFTDKYGRVKVQFHWDREGKHDSSSSCWVRVGTLWAGKQWGVIHIPRIGQEVIVDFIEGDPDQPIIVGSVYNPDTMPPYTLPENKTQSGVKSRSSKGGGPANFNEFRFEDKKGKEEVYLHAEKDWTIMVENDKNQIVGHDETHLVKHDRSKTVNNDETTTIIHNRTETVGSGGDTETITIKGFREETVTKNETITIKEDRKRDVIGEHTTSVGKNETTSVTMNKSDNVGKAYKLTATDSITEAAKEITITAGTKLTLAGPGGSIVIDAGGVTIFGVLVKIN